jgi:Rad3-related DNA helicase
MTERPRAFAALLTTGPSPAEDQVAEAAAVRCDSSGVWSEFFRPALVSGSSAGLVPATRKRSERRPAADVLRALIAHCAGVPLIVEDAGVFAAFLDAQNIVPPYPLLDLADLGRIARPTAADHSLSGLAELLGLEPPDGAGAAPQAALLRDVWERLLDEFGRLPAVALDLICRLAESGGHPLAPVLTEAAGRRGDLELTADAGPEQLLNDQRDLLRRAQRQKADEPRQEPLRTDAICRMFAREGLVGRSLPDYETRSEQVDMAYAVCEALNAGSHLLVEAGTGTGKSLAYLVPAVAWACTNGDKVIISTNTRNLQEQLYRKDLPFLNRLFPDRFESALLKGRTNYLCARRFVHLARYFEREIPDPGDYIALAPIVAWLAGTESGDLAECNGFQLSPAAASLLPALVTAGDECAGRACRFRERCFVHRARALAQLADLLVVNHALLFAESGLDTPVLPPYRCVVFDEAHNLEDVATDALSVVVDGYSVYRVTNFLYRSRRDGSGSGLLATAMYEIGKMRDRPGGTPPGKARDSCSAAMEAVKDVAEAARQFFDLLAEPFAELPPQVERVMLSECRPDVGPDSEAWHASVRLRETVRSLGERIEALAKALEGTAPDAEASAELAGDLRAQVVRLREVCAAAELTLSQQDEAYVYWLERTRRDRGVQCSLHAAPLRVAEYFRDAFLREKRTVVFTSATLQVDRSFDYMLERLGAEGTPADRLRCLALGSSFDYERQALVGVATFLPDPGGRRDSQYDAELSAFLTELLECTQGRAMVLFTSYSLLDTVHDAMKGPLQRAGITVLAQGHGGSREAMTQLFRARPRCVLLGTRSFWEGVDISGEALSCLVLTKLPFHVFTDPLVRGRIEHLRALGRDPFMHYTLPEAVIGFRQGFGRLIRTRTDVGVVVVTDRRLVTKAYGKSFLRSLPARHRVFRNQGEALDEVRRFFAQAEAAGSQ